jgi:hypothetical protein
MQEGTAEEFFIDMFWHDNMQKGTVEFFIDMILA